ALGARCTKAWLAGPALLGSFTLAALNNFILDQDYFGLHDFIALDALALGSAALCALRPRDLERPLPRRVSRWGLAALALLAAGAFLLPSNRMLLRLSSLEGAPLGRLSASLRLLLGGKQDTQAVVQTLPPERRRWFEPTR